MLCSRLAMLCSQFLSSVSAVQTQLTTMSVAPHISQSMYNGGNLSARFACLAAVTPPKVEQELTCKLLDMLMYGRQIVLHVFIRTHTCTVWRAGGSQSPGAGFMNRRRLCQLTAAILTSDLTTCMWVL